MADKPMTLAEVLESLNHILVEAALSDKALDLIGSAFTQVENDIAEEETK